MLTIPKTKVCKANYNLETVRNDPHYLWGQKLVLTNLAQFLRNTEEREKHLEMKPRLSLSLSHTQAQLCSKHNPGSGPTTVWAGLKIKNKINTHEAFEHNNYLSVWDLKQKVKWKKIFETAAVI